MRSRLLFQMLSSMPTRQCWPMISASGWATAATRIAAQNVTTAPCGWRCSQCIQSNGLWPQPPPPYVVMFVFSGPM